MHLKNKKQNQEKFQNSENQNRKMSMNKFMHSRNIYKTPINFNQLAVEFDEIRKASKIVSKISY